MKTYLLLAALLTILLALIVQWRVNGSAAANTAPSYSQIYIHGTPVCILKQGEGIVAMVGTCDPDAGSPPAGPPDMALPPGHPPVSPDMRPDVTGDGSRPIAI